MQETTTKKPRLQHIDALRGFTMLLVVLGHVLKEMGCGLNDTPLSTTILTFRMPVFFFISGYIAYKSVELFTPQFYAKMMRKKLFVQTVPAIIFFLLYAYCSGFSPMLVFTKGFGGYWFTFVLLEMFVVYYLLSLLSRALHFKALMPIGLIVLSVASTTTVMIHPYDHSNLWNFLSIGHFLRYLPYFSIGVLSQKHNRGFLNLVSNGAAKTVIAAGYLVSLLIVFSTDIKSAAPTFHYLNTEIIVRLLGLLFVFSIFNHYRERFIVADDDKRTSWRSVMQYIGRHTLDIYLLHYFFLPNLTQLKGLLSAPSQVILLLCIAAAITVAITAVCLLISATLRISPTLSYAMFGKKVKK